MGHLLIKPPTLIKVINLVKQLSCFCTDTCLDFQKLCDLRVQVSQLVSVIALIEKKKKRFLVCLRKHKQTRIDLKIRVVSNPYTTEKINKVVWLSRVNQGVVEGCGEG